MSILGKKYPESEESFKNTRLDGFFDPQLAGQRMRLKTAYTWETELSKLGNVAAAWEGLISSRKLPYMAGLRNMRNIFLSDINPEICGKYLNYLKNANAVQKSKQMPFQFFTAFNALDDLQNEIKSADEEMKQKATQGKWEGVKFSNSVKFFLEIEWKNKCLSDENLKIFAQVGSQYQVG